MNLREEIFTYLKNDWLTQMEPMDYRLDLQTRQILEFFEKMIDSIVEEQIEDARWRGNTPETDYIPVDKIKEMLK